MWDMHDVGWGWWVLSTIAMVAFWALLIYGVFWLARTNGGRHEPHASPDEVLKRRLATGEIDVEEYERIREALASEPHEPALR